MFLAAANLVDHSELIKYLLSAVGAVTGALVFLFRHFSVKAEKQETELRNRLEVTDQRYVESNKTVVALSEKVGEVSGRIDGIKEGAEIVSQNVIDHIERTFGNSTSNSGSN